MLPFAPIDSPDPLFSEVTIASVREETEDSKTLFLSTRDVLPFKAGQFLTFVFQGAFTRERRSYSISSAEGEALSITVKRVANGWVSRPLVDQAQPGDVLTLAGGAAGFFILPESDFQQELVFLAAGSGITPVFALIKTALRQTRHRLRLIYSNRNPSGTIFHSALHSLQQQYPDRLRIEWLFSTNQDLLRARLSKLLLKQLLQTLDDHTRALYYLCGPFDYMRMAAIVLQTEGVPAENIKREVFTVDKPQLPIRPPDQERHEVWVRFRGNTHKLQVQYPESILMAARKIGLELPYSCEAGRCGSCVASCTSGRVWMKYNEVLTDREVAAGRALICNAFPIGGDAVIDFDL